MKYPLVMQHSEEDCGAACLASIAKYHGRTFTLTRLREAIGTGQLGTTLLGLRRGAEAMGFLARSATASWDILDRINQITLPAIIHWCGNHWVVFYGKRGDRYVVADPAVGLRDLRSDDLRDGWRNGVILLLEPDPVRFYAQPNDPVQGIGSVLKRLWPYRGLLLEAVACVTIIGLLSLASPFFIQILTDNVLIQGNTRLLVGIVIAVIVMYTVRSGLNLVADNLIAHFAQRLELELILEFGRQILQLPLTYYETRRSGEVIGRLRDIEEINRLVTEVVISLPSSLLIAIASLGLMLFYSWPLTGVAIAIAVVMTLSTVLLQPVLQQKTRQAMVLETETQGVLVEAFKGALTLKTTTAAPQFWDEVQSRFGRLANLLLRTAQIGIFNGTFSDWVNDIGKTVILGLGGVLVIRQDLTIGQLLAFTSLNSNIGRLMDELVDLVDDYARAKTAHQRLQEVVTATPETQNETKKPWVALDGHADLECDRLHFHYPGRVNLLHDFSLTLPGGNVIAIIGKSGCGKSTLAKVIAGLYVPQSGNVRVGNYNLGDLAMDCLRRQIVLVPQDAHFWSRSILENFQVGNPYLSFDQVVEACRQTGADGFIRRLPERYQTVLGEFGSNLSGGQRQRLAIARGIVNDPPILILDESTAGLDPVSETQVLKQVLDSRRGKTTILISHRPRVIQLADWIVYLEDGILKRQGSPADLRDRVGDHTEFLTP
jgi:ATP-binding cassette subfamily C protein